MAWTTPADETGPLGTIEPPDCAASRPVVPIEELGVPTNTITDGVVSNTLHARNQAFHELARQGIALLRAIAASREVVPVLRADIAEWLTSCPECTDDVRFTNTALRRYLQRGIALLSLVGSDAMEEDLRHDARGWIRRVTERSGPTPCAGS